MSNSQSDSRGAAPRKRVQQKTAAPSPFVDVTEQKRLNEAREAGTPWKKWGPYLSERQWGTVREDYSQDGNAWAYFSHDQSRSRAYRWGEDGIGGFSDDEQRLCFALALWNERDPILKERLFGVTNSEGNHGEDVKEYYYYIDSTPTHSYMKYLYKYPQREFPYRDLVETNQRRSRQELEYELIDTGIFDDDRYFDVFLEYAKGGPDDILIRVTVHNRGPEAARLHLLPTLWFRNTWSWTAGTPKPNLREVDRAIGERSWPRTPNLAITHSLATAPAPALPSFCSPKTRPTRSASGASRTLLPGLRMRSTNMSFPGTARPLTRRRPARRLRPATSSTCPPAARRSSACD